MKNSFFKGFVKWIMVPLGFCGIGYYLVGPSLGKDFSVKYSLSDKKDTKKTSSSLAVKTESQKENLGFNSNDIEFTVEDITLNTETPANKPTPDNFPKTLPRKPKGKVTPTPQPSVTVVEDPTEDIENAESEL